MEASRASAVLSTLRTSFDCSASGTLCHLLQRTLLFFEEASCVSYIRGRLMLSGLHHIYHRCIG